MNWRFFVLGALVGMLIYCHEYRPDAITLATAPYQFSAVTWELGNLPDKWTHRVRGSAGRLLPGDNNHAERLDEVTEFFALGLRLREIDGLLIELSAQGQAGVSTPSDATTYLRTEQSRLRQRQSYLRPRVEETVESAVADTLEAQGFKAWTGVFPPVDTSLTSSPTVLIMSPRDLIFRLDDVVLRPGLTNDQRERIEGDVESATGLSALVVDTGGIAFYPSITLPDAGLDFALEVIAHEWVHQWLWFRPLGQRYFEGGDITAINETVADIAGREIGELARRRLVDTPPPTSPSTSPQPGDELAEPRGPVALAPPPFDFQAEMRATRIRLDELLASGDVPAAEAYLEERRQEFVANGYPIRRLNQAYFAFHGTYATTGAAGVSVIGQQVAELRRRSPTLASFLRTAAEIEGPDDLADLLSPPAR